MEWSVKSNGKIISILSHLTFSILILIWFSAKIDKDPNKEFLDAFIEAILVTIGTGFIFFIAGVIIPIYWILKKKIPTKISISDDSKISFHYKKRKKITANNSILAFSIYHYPFYSVLVFYKIYKAENGENVYKEIFDIIATISPFSWKPQMFQSIAVGLEKNGFYKRIVNDKKNYLTRILG